MLSALSVGLLGLLLGLKHATDADHVVAVTTMVAREQSFRRAAWIGGLWGIGHSLTVFIVGGAIVVFRMVIPPRVGLGLEFGVALMLILIGFTNLRGNHADEGAQGHLHPHKCKTRLPVMVGIVHGLAGSAAVAILVLAAIPDVWWALAYLFVFGIGTIVGMLVVTGLIAAPVVYARERSLHCQRRIRLVAGTLSIAFGLLLAREIVVNGGLFSEFPEWSLR
jgi:high-affinity nickel-transport protein